MAKRRDFTYQSRDGITMIKAYEWAPDDDQIVGIVQIIHGMAEHMTRYDNFASFLTDNHYLVVGNDHLGHGDTAKCDEDLGYIAKTDASTIIVRDVHRLKKITQEAHPGLPYIILGFSMGSFVARKYIMQYGTGIDAAIIAGTGFHSKALCNFGRFVTRFTGVIHDEKYRSKFICKCIFGANNKRIKNVRTNNDWLSKETDIVDKYEADKYCGFLFTVNGYMCLYDLTDYSCTYDNVTKIPKDLPILLTSGAEDPVGNYGKAVQKTYEQYKKAGIKNITIKLYENDRHEIFNETDKETVYQDVLSWIKTNAKGNNLN